MSLLLEAWREAGRQPSLADLVERFTPEVGREIPIKGLLIRRLEPDRQRLETIAEGTVGPYRPGITPRTQLTPVQVEALAAYGRGGALGGSGTRGVVELIAPCRSAEEALIAPLLDAGSLLGFAVAIGARGCFGSAHEALWQEVAAPLSAGLRSELQRQELMRYRSALEADRQALLSRLGRQEIADAIVGAESGLREVMDRIDRVAATDVPVLLLGETGTGKEVIARAIHNASPRADGPVVRVNCGAIPAGLIDSELFGHERGSFTGAIADRAGWFERADGGTLFLDEIGELPPDAQVRLLRVLQDGTFERVGGRKTRTVDVRIVAATHRDLQSMLLSGTFREDLWYRISVFPIRLPPLRERPADIPALAEHFAWRAGKRLGGSPLAPTSADLELLIAYPWPGNVRELASVIERAVLLGGGHRLEVGAALGVALPTTATGVAVEAPAPRLATLDEAQTRHIVSALVACGGRIEGPKGVAAILDINPHTLRARMRKLGIDWKAYREVEGARRQS